MVRYIYKHQLKDKSFFTLFRNNKIKKIIKFKGIHKRW